MAVTYYVALPFVRNEEGERVPGEAQDRQSAAESFARKLALREAGAVAFPAPASQEPVSSRMPSCPAPSARCRALRPAWRRLD